MRGFFQRRRGTAAATPPPIDGRRSGRATVTWAVETTRKHIALTFDDGPVPNCTPLVLDALDTADIAATFFLVGQRLKENAHLVEGRLDRHEVGNHTWSHKNLSTLDFSTAHAEIERAHDIVSELVGREPRLLRPPFGHLGSLALRAADRFAYDVILWSQGVTEREFQEDPESVVPYVLDNMTPGTIFLAHDAVAPGVEPAFLHRLGRIIDNLKTKGYEFRTVSELLSSAA